MKKIICFFFGHKITNMLLETEYAIYTKGCSRCKQPTTLPTAWKNIPPPPSPYNISDDKWKEFLEKHYEEVRESVNINI